VSATEAFFASRAMQALEVLAFGPATVTQVAGELQVHSRTARRLLNRMVHDGWLVRRDGPRPTYSPTMRIVALAAQLAQRSPLVSNALEFATDLHARTGADAHLAIPSYRSALRLLRVSRADHHAPALRDLAPANAIAAGKVLLAYRVPWSEVVLAAPLSAVTDRTVVDPTELRRELDAVREQGYAVEDGEYRPGVRALAAPVRGEGEEVIAALVVSSSSPRADDLLAFESELSAAADLLSARLVTPVDRR
jgi:DNA-binding IclR family transcriptional regulator